MTVARQMTPYYLQVRLSSFDHFIMQSMQYQYWISISDAVVVVVVGAQWKI
jgi:hypothetical protein